jgi:hypothetical protein
MRRVQHWREPLFCCTFPSTSAFSSWLWVPKNCPGRPVIVGVDPQNVRPCQNAVSVGTQLTSCDLKREDAQPDQRLAAPCTWLVMVTSMLLPWQPHDPCVERAKARGFNAHQTVSKQLQLHGTWHSNSRIADSAADCQFLSCPGHLLTGCEFARSTRDLCSMCPVHEDTSLNT